MKKYISGYGSWGELCDKVFRVEKVMENYVDMFL